MYSLKYFMVLKGARSTIQVKRFLNLLGNTSSAACSYTVHVFESHNLTIYCIKIIFF